MSDKKQQEAKKPENKGENKDKEQVQLQKEKKKSAPVYTYLTDEFFNVIKFALENSDWDDESVPIVERTLETLNRLKNDIKAKESPVASKKLKLPKNIAKAIEAGESEMPQEMADMVDAGIAIAESAISADEFAARRGVEFMESDIADEDVIEPGVNKIAIMEQMGIEHGAPVNPAAGEILNQS